jgi:hypothetical protein
LQRHKKLDRIIARRAERGDDFLQPPKVAELIEHEQHGRQRGPAGWRVLVRTAQSEVDEYPQKLAAAAAQLMTRAS